MGRFYFGTISGKFWGLTQMSNDASNFKDNTYNGPFRCYEYIECGCIVENTNQLYCNYCYNCIEEHIINLFDLDDYNEKSLIKKSNIYEYYFEKNELNYVKERLKDLENKLELIQNDIIKKLDIAIFDTNDINTSYTYEIDEKYLKNMSNEQLSLVARWCLGKLIEFSIINLDYCKIFCE
jgi:hypothetical protein